MPEIVYTTNRTRLQGARIWKWDYQSDMTLTGGQVGMENDFYIMRYADVVLMYLEALLRQNKAAAEPAAITAFDKIRTRAGVSPIEESVVDIDFILHDPLRQVSRLMVEQACNRRKRL